MHSLLYAVKMSTGSSLARAFPEDASFISRALEREQVEQLVPGEALTGWEICATVLDCAFSKYMKR